MLAQDALSGAVNVLVVARRVLSEQLKGPALKGKSRGAGATLGRASQRPSKGKVARQTTSPSRLRFDSSSTRAHEEPNAHQTP